MRVDINYLDLIKKAEKEGINRFVVGAIITKENKILLLKRKPEDFMGGIFEIPGGKVENNETIELAVVREVEEETGLQVMVIEKFMDYFDYSSASGKKTRQFNFLVKTRAGKVILTEHDEFIWSDNKKLDKLKISDEIKKTVRNFFRISGD